jgi:precorrin-3B methylase
MRLERAPARVGIAIIPGVTTSSCNPRRIGFPIYSTFQLQIESLFSLGPLTLITQQVKRS